MDNVMIGVLGLVFVVFRCLVVILFPLWAPFWLTGYIMSRVKRSI